MRAVCVATSVAGLLALAPATAQAAACDPALPSSIPKYVEPLVIPPAMPPEPKANIAPGHMDVTEYEIGARQFDQYVLPESCGKTTTVWGYGKYGEDATYNFPGYTVEGRSYEPIRVRWVNELVDDENDHLPHLLPVDETLHQATPVFRNPNVIVGQEGPVALVTHVHGAHVDSHSDGGPEQWWLPNAKRISARYANRGPRYQTQFPVPPGQAVYHYDQSQRASTLWYHDHALGLTRLNVYAGLAGFWIVRDAIEDGLNLPGPAPQVGDAPDTKYYEIPLAIQDRSFEPDGDWFYPQSRAFFDGYTGPYFPETPVPPVWNPEFFGNAMVVNGKTWPYLDVEPRKYRFRILNGCNSRFLILKLTTGGTGNGPPTIHQIGNEGGFLSGAPITPEYLLLGPAERADIIIDFSQHAGTTLELVNVGPDEPFGGLPDGFDPDDSGTWEWDPPTAETSKVMQFRVSSTPVADASSIPISLPHVTPLTPDTDRRYLTLNEEIYEAADVPVAALLGTLEQGALRWEDEVTERVGFNDTEPWWLLNLTVDSHPIHLHLVHFQVTARYEFDSDAFLAAQNAYLIARQSDPSAEPPDPDDYLGEELDVFPWESGWKETVIADPGEVTVVTAKFDKLGWYVWHCHIVEHEDNEMMRPFVVQ